MQQIIERELAGWKLKLLALATPWWLAILPTFCAWFWRVAFEAKLPAILIDLLPLSYLVLVLSGLVAVSSLKSIFSKWSQEFSRWYVISCGALAPTCAYVLLSSGSS